VLEAALESRLPLLASAARRVLNEERYHIEHAVEWLDLLSAQPRQARRLQSALQRVCQIGGDPLVTCKAMAELGRQGWIRPAPELAARYGTALSARLEAAGWPTAAVTAIARRVSRGEAGKRPPGLLALHHDLTGLRRGYPGATW
jgi:ring-1,2-phenylacetyl-CoA epoxidase subunit PaaC